jgi:hypothetical protein
VIAAAALASLSAASVRAETWPAAERDQLVRVGDVTFAKYKGRKYMGPNRKVVKRGGPPPWAPAHGLRRKRGY